MTAKELSQEEVVTKLFEFKSRVKTAEYFGVTKDTILRRLQEWGVSADFRKKLSEEKKVLDSRPPFHVGDHLIWKPSKARHGHFGAPIAYLPVKVQVVRGPTDRNYYDVVILDSKYSAILGRRPHHVVGTSLHLPQDEIIKT